jgi:hypothetical protein
MAIRLAGRVEVPVMQTVGSAGVDGGLDLSEGHGGRGVVDIVVCGWEVEGDDDGGAEVILVEFGAD